MIVSLILEMYPIGLFPYLLHTRSLAKTKDSWLTYKQLKVEEKRRNKNTGSNPEQNPDENKASALGGAILLLIFLYLVARNLG